MYAKLIYDTNEKTVLYDARKGHPYIRIIIHSDVDPLANPRDRDRNLSRPLVETNNDAEILKRIGLPMMW